MSLSQRITFIFSIFLHTISNGQNLVPNPSFEMINVCDGFNISSVRYNIPIYWYSPINFNQPYYFNACANTTNQSNWGGVPNNWLGPQTARTGVAYSGINVWQNNCELRQYIQVRLNQTLQQGQNIYFEMWVSLSDASQYASDGLQAYFSANRLRPNDTTSYYVCTSLLNVTPQVSQPNNVTINNSTGWTKVSGTFIATGGEQWLTIGNFKTNLTTTVQNVSTSQGSMANSIYFIDDIYVSACGHLPETILPKDTNLCGASIPLNIPLNAYIPNVNSYQWNTGANSSSITAVFPGTYSVIVTSGTCVLYDTIRITNSPKPTANLGPDLFLCNNQIALLSPAVTNAQTFRWSHNTTAGSLYTFFPGLYWVEVTSAGGCKARDSIFITYSPPPTSGLPKDTVVCGSTSIILNADYPGASYRWNNGSTNSTFMVSDTGKFWVEVNNNGCKKTDTIHVNRIQIPPLNLGNDTSICANQSLKLNASSFNADTYLWSNGLTLSNIAIKDAGTYWLKIGKSGCFISDTITITHKPIPYIGFQKDTNICEGIGLELDAKNPGATYLWNTNQTTQKINVSADGFYKVKVKLNGCEQSDSINVFTSTRPSFDIGNDTLLCEGSTIQLNIAVSGATYSWQDSSTKYFYHINKQGKYKVTVSKGPCSISDSVQVFYVPKPVFDLGNDTVLCLNEPFMLNAYNLADSYLWNDGSTLPFKSISSPGKYWVQVTQSVCLASDTIWVYQKKLPVVSLGTDRLVCKESFIELNAGNYGSNYEWDDFSVNPIRDVFAPGNFHVKVTNDIGCFVIDSIRLDTFISPILNLGNDTFLCKGAALQLIADKDFAGYEWSNGSTIKNSIVNAAGKYWLAVTDTNNCIAIDTLNVIEKALPEINIPNTYKTCEPDFTVENYNVNAKYLWNDGSTESFKKINSYGVYSIQISDENQCVNYKIFEVVNACPAKIFVPNAFTPNGDMINDNFIPVTTNVTSIHYQIYDRWGKMIFETSDLKQYWDGTTQGIPQASDVYFYIINYTGMDGANGLLKGNITLLK